MEEDMRSLKLKQKSMSVDLSQVLQALIEDRKAREKKFAKKRSVERKNNEEISRVTSGRKKARRV